MSVLDNDNKIIFLRKLEKKRCEHSFGINVAKLAGLPQQIIIRAGEILKHLEKLSKKNKNGKQKDLFSLDEEDNYKQYFNRLKQFLEVIDVNTITPVEALVRLQELKKIVKTV
jgi:DNA mismatch repair protein MutS